MVKVRRHLCMCIVAVLAAVISKERFFPSYDLDKINTLEGTVEGFTSKSRDGRTFIEFRGIPYGTAGRFEDPIPVKPWKYVKSALNYGPKCLQYDIFLDMVFGEEDCLYLNVYKPHNVKDSSENLLPVVVWIHGGMFLIGSGEDYRPDYWMDHDVIVVTVNYRLGAYGFLNIDGHGNMGLKDQVEALKWIQRNINNFNGDPENVLIMGESAGSVSTHLMMLSPIAKGLFQKSVSMSGTALVHWSLIREPQKQAHHLAKKLDCPTTPPEISLSCLKSLPAKDIVKVHSQEMKDIILHERVAAYGPTIESKNSSYPFLTQHPYHLMATKQIVNKVPWVTGTNSHEGLIFTAGVLKMDGVAEELNKNWTFWAPIIFDYEDHSDKEKISQQIYSMYLGENEINFDSLYKIVDLFSDSAFYAGVEASARMMSAAHVPTYTYLYSYQGHFGPAQMFFRLTGWLLKPLDCGFALASMWFQENILGVQPHRTCHFDGVGQLFKIDFVSNIKENERDYKFSKAFVKLFVDFATTGVPVGLEGSQWPLANYKDNGELSYLHLNANHSAVIQNPFNSKRLELWDTLLKKTV